MSRGGTLLAAALTLASAAPAAAGETGAQPDLMIVSRHGQVLNGDGIYNDTGVGQQRNVVVDKRVVLQVRLENDSKADAKFVIESSPAGRAFRIRYLADGTDVTDLVTGTSDARFGRRVRSGDSETLRLVIDADPSADLGADVDLIVRAQGTDGSDAVLIKLTKTSTPD